MLLIILSVCLCFFETGVFALQNPPISGGGRLSKQRQTFSRTTDFFVWKVKYRVLEKSCFHGLKFLLSGAWQGKVENNY